MGVLQQLDPVSQKGGWRPRVGQHEAAPSTAVYINSMECLRSGAHPGAITHRHCAVRRNRL